MLSDRLMTFSQVPKPSKGFWYYFARPLAWIAGITVSFLPMFLQLADLLLSNETIDINFFRDFAWHGQVLWISAALILMACVDFLLDLYVRHRKNERFGFFRIVWLVITAVIALILIVLYYMADFRETYQSNTVFNLSLIIFIVSFVSIGAMQFFIARE